MSLMKLVSRLSGEEILLEVSLLKIQLLIIVSKSQFEKENSELLLRLLNLSGDELLLSGLLSLIFKLLFKKKIRMELLLKKP